MNVVVNRPHHVIPINTVVGTRLIKGVEIFKSVKANVYIRFLSVLVIVLLLVILLRSFSLFITKFVF